jgi:hypothetical protein
LVARSATTAARRKARAPQPAPLDPVEELRGAASGEDDNGQPIYEPTDPARPIGHANPPRRTKGKSSQQAPRPSRLEVERRIAEAQLWIAQRIPLVLILEKARESWGVNNTQTINRYLNLARERMVQELISDRRRHQAEQIFALNECARRAMDAEQFSAAVGAFRVIAEIGGLLRAPIKPPEAKG